MTADLDSTPRAREAGLARGDFMWQDFARCKGRTALFFAPKAERPQARARREARAQRLCESCPVQLPCRDFARKHHEYGYWGGESEEARHRAGFTLTAPIGIRARQSA
jgi:WhiB family redox-sensing transcriptional regulator